MIRTAPKSWKQWGLVGVHPSYSIRNFFRLSYYFSFTGSRMRKFWKSWFEKIPTIIVEICRSKGNFLESIQLPFFFRLPKFSKVVSTLWNDEKVKCLSVLWTTARRTEVKQTWNYFSNNKKLFLLKRKFENPFKKSLLFKRSSPSKNAQNSFSNFF